MIRIFRTRGTPNYLLGQAGRLKSWQIFSYIFLMVLCFLFFAQADLSHTIASSYAYLGGHVIDFYDFNKIQVGGNDYLPLFYVIFAFWNLPLYLLHLTTSSGLNLSPTEIAWSKLMLAVFFFATAYVTEKIYRQIQNKETDVSFGAWALFATAPIAIFSTFIFSQYDIIGLLFSMIGFYYLLKKERLRFAWFFSIAISFKFFALVIFVPLVLLLENRKLEIVKLLLIGSVVTLLQFAAYWHSDVFQNEIFNLATRKANGILWRGLFFIFLYIVMCIFLYLKRFQNDFEWKRTAVFLPIIAYGLMFSAVAWHPQWLIIVMPFFVLAYAFIRNVQWFALLEILGMLSFVWLCVNFFPYNVDVGMINQGVLKNVMPVPNLIISNLLVPSLTQLFNKIFYVYLFSPVVFVIFESLSKSRKATHVLSRTVFFSRFCSILFFVVPALICTFGPLSLVLKIKP